MRAEGYQYLASLAQRQVDNDQPYQWLSQNQRKLHQFGNQIQNSQLCTM